MGEVTLAVKKGSPDVRKLVVLKTLRRDMLGDAAIRKMFSEEACLSARLSHPNVVQVFGVIAADSPVLVMEYLDGKPLSAILKRAGDRCSIAMQLRILSHVLAGLHYSHELRDYDGTPLNIVHRDISPQNVFVTYGGLVKVLDFGLAKVATKRSRTKSGMVKGKLEYMPAEQMIAGEVDRRADIYAVGCMLWQTCSGERLATTAAAGTASASNDSTNTSLVASGHNVMTRQRKASARTDNSCNPPHYYKDGLKYFKPQCL